MIEKKVNFDDFNQNHAVWCGADSESADLARDVDVLCQANMDYISVAPAAVKTVWPWLENKNVKIMARFYMTDSEMNEDLVSDVTKRINTVLKNGAHGAQVFLPYNCLADLVAQTHIIRDDLFFNKDLSIGVDICEIDSSEWKNLFELLHQINASSLMLFMSKDLGNKSDFTGRIYGLLDAWSDENNFDLHFYFGPNFMRIEQTGRLIQSLRPGLMKNTRFFVGL